MLACVAHVLTRNFATKKVREAHWSRFTVSRIPVHLPGATRTIGVRLATALDFPFSEVSVPIYVDLVGFAEGPAEVVVLAGSATQPVPAATEGELLALLLARAKSEPALKLILADRPRQPSQGVVAAEHRVDDRVARDLVLAAPRMSLSVAP